MDGESLGFCRERRRFLWLRVAMVDSLQCAMKNEIDVWSSFCCVYWFCDCCWFVAIAVETRATPPAEVADNTRWAVVASHSHYMKLDQRENARAGRAVERRWHL